METERPVEVESQPAQTRAVRIPFPIMVGTSFLYPLTGSGVFTLIGGTILLVAASFLGVWGILGLIFLVPIWGYLVSYLIRIITDSGEGDDTPPVWPDLSDLVSDVLRPLWLFMVPSVLAFTPFIVLLLLDKGDPAGISTTGYWICTGLAVFLLPMMLLSVSMHDSFRGLNPIVLAPAYVRVFPSYLLALVILAVAVWVEGWLKARLIDLSIWVGLIVGQTVSLYMLMVEARVLGLLYRCHRHKLRWEV